MGDLPHQRTNAGCLEYKAVSYTLNLGETQHDLDLLIIKNPLSYISFNLSDCMRISDVLCMPSNMNPHTYYLNLTKFNLKLN